MYRFIALLIVVLGLAPGTWWRVVPSERQLHGAIAASELQVPAQDRQMPHLGPFVLEKVWKLESRHHLFGGYSALLVTHEGGELLAFSDQGNSLRMRLPGPVLSDLEPTRVFSSHYRGKSWRDIEAAAYDPDTSTIWTAVENINAILRFNYRDGNFAINGVAVPPKLFKWSGNSGPETFLRLENGRFIALRESFDGLFERRRHVALLFDRDPVEDRDAKHFAMSGPEGFRPTDAALMPDGRVMILFRRLLWPLPARFAGRIAIGDPDEIRPGKTWRVKEVAKLSSSLPVDNFEGLAIEPGDDGRLVVWLISDDNRALYQQTLLWKLTVDPRSLR